MSKRQSIEKVLGGSVTPFDQEPLPGTNESSDRIVIFVQDRPGLAVANQLKEVSRRISPPHIKHGSVGATMHALRLPDGMLMHAFRCAGDLVGWRHQINQGARELDLATGTVDHQNIVLSNGTSFELSACEHQRL